MAVINNDNRSFESDTHGADTKISTFKVLSTIDVKAFVNNTTLLTGFHRTGTETVPGSLAVAL